MKRFTDTEKWRDPWFRRLSSPAKQLWLYALDQCDKIGLVEIDLELASGDCGQKIKQENLTELASRLENCGNNKFFITKFIHFQYGDLSETCPPHKPILQLAKIHGLTRDGLLYHYPKPTLSDTLALGYKIRQEEEEDKKRTRQEGGAGGCYSPESRVALHYLNEKSGRSFRESESSLSVIQARLSEAGVDIAGVRLMIDRQCDRWKGTAQEEYLRPETLFGKTKFDAYYAAKDLPVVQNGKLHKTPDHAKGF